MSRITFQLNTKGDVYTARLNDKEIGALVQGGSVWLIADSNQKHVGDLNGYPSMIMAMNDFVEMFASEEEKQESAAIQEKLAAYYLEEVREVAANRDFSEVCAALPYIDPAYINGALNLIKEESGQ